MTTSSYAALAVPSTTSGTLAACRCGTSARFNPAEPGADQSVRAEGATSGIDKLPNDISSEPYRYRMPRLSVRPAAALVALAAALVVGCDADASDTPGGSDPQKSASTSTADKVTQTTTDSPTNAEYSAEDYFEAALQAFEDAGVDSWASLSMRIEEGTKGSEFAPSVTVETFDTNSTSTLYSYEDYSLATEDRQYGAANSDNDLTSSTVSYQELRKATDAILELVIPGYEWSGFVGLWTAQPSDVAVQETGDHIAVHISTEDRDGFIDNGSECTVPTQAISITVPSYQLLDELSYDDEYFPADCEYYRNLVN
jgi:hypothetical protein